MVQDLGDPQYYPARNGRVLGVAPEMAQEKPNTCNGKGQKQEHEPGWPCGCVFFEACPLFQCVSKGEQREHPRIFFRQVWDNVLGVDSPFFSTIVLFNSRLFPRGLDGVLKRFGSLERMEMEATPRKRPCGVLESCPGFLAEPSQPFSAI